MGDKSKLWLALLAFQKQVATVTRDAKADAGRKQYRYATLEAVESAIRVPLADAGLMHFHQFSTELLSAEYTQMGETTAWENNQKVSKPIYGMPAKVSVLTTIVHAESGESVTADVQAICNVADVQAVGSLHTYLRRYGLMAVLGLAPDDDDGQAARGAPTATPAPAPVPPPATKPPRDWLKESAMMRNRAQLLALYNEAKAAGAQKAILDALAAKGKALAEAEKVPPAPVDEGPHQFFDAEPK